MSGRRRPTGPSPAARLAGASVALADGRLLVGPLDLELGAGEHWAVLGPNGAGKTTLLRLLGAERQPSSGTVELLGREVGRCDLRELRALVGVVSHAVADRLPAQATALEIVLTGRRGDLAPSWSRYDDDDRARALEVLGEVGAAPLADRPLAHCSQGERQRVLLARSLFVAHPLLLLDEPAAAVDLPGREALVAALERLAASSSPPTTVHVTHALEDLPAATSHVLLLRGGAAVAAGPVDDVLTEEQLSACFALAIRLTRVHGRFSAQAAPSW